MKCQESVRKLRYKYTIKGRKIPILDLPVFSKPVFFSYIFSLGILLLNCLLSYYFYISLNLQVSQNHREAQSTHSALCLKMQCDQICIST